MSIRVMTRVWEHSQAKGSGLLLLLAIADFAHDDGGGAWPSISKLAKKIRMNSRTTQRIIESLVEMGELEVREREGPNFTNLYRVRLENLAPGKMPGVTSGKLPPPTPGILPPTPGKSSVRPLAPRPPKPLIAEEPSWNRQQQQQQGLFQQAAAAADSRYDLALIKIFVQETKTHSTNPGGLARMLHQTGADDAEVGQWLTDRKARTEKYLDIALRWLDEDEDYYESEMDSVLTFASRSRNQAFTQDEQIILNAAESMREFRRNELAALLQKHERSDSHEATDSSDR